MSIPGSKVTERGVTFTETIILAFVLSFLPGPDLNLLAKEMWKKGQTTGDFSYQLS